MCLVIMLYYHGIKLKTKIMILIPEPTAGTWTTTPTESGVTPLTSVSNAKATPFRVNIQAGGAQGPLVESPHKRREL